MRVIHGIWITILVSIMMLSSLILTAAEISFRDAIIFIVLLIVSIALIIITPKPPK